MKFIIKKISILILFIFCFSAICMTVCAAQPAPEAPQSNIGSDVQTESSSEKNTESSTDAAEKSGAFSNLDPMNKENITKSLQIFGKGMVAIFAVVIIIIIVVLLVQKTIAALTAPPKGE